MIEEAFGETYAEFNITEIEKVNLKPKACSM